MSERVSKLYDHTMLSQLLQCEQEYVWRHQQHLARPAPDASAHFGTVVHAGVRALFDGKSAEQSAQQSAESWGDFVAPPKKAHLNLAYAQDVVEKYAEFYFGATQPFELVLNEHYLESAGRFLCGIVDRVVRSNQDGQLYVMDTKTTGLFLNQAWFEQWRHSLQAAIYLDLTEHELAATIGGTPTVAGFWVDAIHVNRRGYAKREDFMRVGPFPYSQELRKELRSLTDELVLKAQLLDSDARGPLKNPRNCFRFNNLCSFFDYCTMNPNDRKDAIAMALASGELVEHIWDPKARGNGV